jgi:hypothetical protein
MASERSREVPLEMSQGPTLWFDRFLFFLYPYQICTTFPRNVLIGRGAKLTCKSSWITVLHPECVIIASPIDAPSFDLLTKGSVAPLSSYFIPSAAALLLFIPNYPLECRGVEGAAFAYS